MKIPNGYMLYKYQSLDSTNTKAMSLFSDFGISTGTVVVADVQTKGRGRGNKSWISHVGNLYLSVILDISKIDHVSILPFLSSIVVGDTIAELCPKYNCFYKWPNDLIIQDMKIAGILIDLCSDNCCIVGIGINIKSIPDDLSNVTSLSECGYSGEIEHVIEVLLRNIDNGFNQYDRYSVLQQWMDNAYMLNENTVANLPDGDRVSGIFKGIDKDGNAMFETSLGKRSISTMDLFSKG